MMMCKLVKTFATQALDDGLVHHRWRRYGVFIPYFWRAIMVSAATEDGAVIKRNQDAHLSL